MKKIKWALILGITFSLVTSVVAVQSSESLKQVGKGVQTAEKDRGAPPLLNSQTITFEKDRG